MFLAFYFIITNFPNQISFLDALSIAGKAEKLNFLDFSINLKNRYTFWSGITGGLFLSLSYFGTDQSQVQRYLSGKSLSQSRLGLMMNGLLKIPMQFIILFIGVMVFVFYFPSQMWPPAVRWGLLRICRRCARQSNTESGWAFFNLKLRSSVAEAMPECWYSLISRFFKIIRGPRGQKYC